MKSQKNKITLLNASSECYKGKPKNHISTESIDKIAKAFIKAKDQDRFVKVITKEEAVKNDYNLSPSRYVSLSEEAVYRPIPQILSELKSLNKEEKKIDIELEQIFKKLKPQIEEQENKNEKKLEKN